jgi:hypothetical protein
MLVVFFQSIENEIASKSILFEAEKFIRYLEKHTVEQ